MHNNPLKITTQGNSNRHSGGQGLQTNHQIEPLQPKDCALLTNPSMQSPLTHWSLDTLLIYCTPCDYSGWVCRSQDDAIIGYLLGRQIPPHAELDRMFILPDYRRKGIARALLMHWVQNLKAQQPEGGIRLESIWLEVRTSNLPAIACYQAVGFQTFYDRPDYYPLDSTSASRDAHVMGLILSDFSASSNSTAGKKIGEG